MSIRLAFKGGSKKMSNRSIVCAGIDTGKHKLDVALHGRSHDLEVANTAEGHERLLAWLRRHGVKRVGIEASGGYEQTVVWRLRRGGLVVVVFQPAQVRAYGRFHLKLAKNDKIDAALIADCTAAIKTIHAPPDRRLADLGELQTQIDQIAAAMRRFKNYRESCRDARLRQFWDEDPAISRALPAAAQGAGGRDPPAPRSRRTARADPQRRWHCGAHRDCDRGAHARDRQAQPGSGRGALRACSLR